MRQFEQTVLSFLLLRIGIGGEGVTERFLVIGSEIEPMHVTIGNNIGEAQRTSEGKPLQTAAATKRYVCLSGGKGTAF